MAPPTGFLRPATCPATAGTLASPPMPIDPRELARFRHAQPSIIQNNRACVHCGYNLKGLRQGGVCPECGQPMPTAGAQRLRDTIAEAPLSYLRSLVVGLTIMAFASIAGALVLYLAPVSSLKAIGLAGAGLAWWFGIYIVTERRTPGPHAAHDAILDSSRLRMTNRLVQAAWILAGIGWFGIAQRVGWFGNVFIFVALVMPLVGLMGLIPVSIYLSALADWGSHSALGHRFRATAWILSVCGIVAVLTAALSAVSSAFTGFLWLTLAGSSLVLLVAQGVFVVSLLQLVFTVNSAIGSARFAHDRDLRRVERLKRGGEVERQCGSCGYSLLGLSLLTPCPECGWMDPEVRSSNLGALAALRPRERKSSS